MDNYAKAQGLTCARLAWVLLFMMAAVTKPVGAHEGPPFPLIVDQKLGSYILSVWADPDVGTGTFFVIANLTGTGMPPPDLKVQIGVKPVSDRLPEVVYSAEPERLKNQVQYRAAVQFDAQELWRVRIHLQSEQGTEEMVTTVEATPPGYGRWDLLIYLVPFLAVGFLWLLAYVRRHPRAPI